MSGRGARRGSGEGHARLVSRSGRASRSPRRTVLHPGRPVETICAAAVPFWIHFSVQPALQSLNEYLDKTEPYRHVNVFLFEHGTESPGIATPDDFQAVVRRHGSAVQFDGLDPERFPHDIGTLGRYGQVFDELPGARHPWSPLPVDEALRGLAAAGLSVTAPG